MSPRRRELSHNGADHQLIVRDAHSFQTTSPEFFKNKEHLTRSALRALHYKIPYVSFLLIEGRTVRRIRIETAPGASTSAVLTARAEPPPFALTAKELEVATCVAGGLSNPQIAELYNCARRTISTHVEHILTKLEVGSRSAVAALIAAAEAYVAPLPTSKIELPETLALVLFPSSEATRETGLRANPVTKRSIRLASIFPEGNGSRYDAGSMRRGAQLAVTRINRMGGVGGRSIEHLAVEASAGNLVETIKKLQGMDVDAFTLGNFPRSEASEGIRMASDSGAPLLHGMVNPTLSKEVMHDLKSLGNTFQICATEDAYISAFTRTLSMFMDTGQWKPAERSVVLVVRKSTLEWASAEYLQNQIEAKGWTLGLLVAADDYAPNMASVAADVSRVRPAAVFVSVFPEPDLQTFMSEMKAQGIPSVVYTAWSPTVPNFASRLGPIAEGLVWSTVIGTYEDPVSAPFRKLYASTYAQDPGSGGAAVHFDMVNILASAWAQASAPWDFKAVTAPLRETVYRGAAGPYYFGGEGQRALSFPDDTQDASLGHLHLVHQIQRGASRLIGPPPLSVHKFIPLSGSA